MKRIISFFCLTMFMSMSACSAEQGQVPTASDFVEGKDYSLLARPVRTADPSKIEVLEFFWYGCIHCFNLEPALNEWKSTLAEDVSFIAAPAIWAPQMELHAKMLYANAALGLEDQLHMAIFEEMNVKRNQLPNERAILAFIEKQGVDPEKYRRALNSFGVNSQAQQAKSRMGAYGVRGTPEIVINGKYKLTTAMAGGHERMLEIAGALIAKERATLAN